MEKIKKFVGYSIGIIVVIIVGIWIFSDNSTSSSRSSGDSDFYYIKDKSINKYDALSDNWDDIREYIDGSYEVEACSGKSGDCYILNADISYGTIEIIYFSNGGSLSVSAEINSDGEAESYDVDDDYWTFDIDKDIIDDALNDWAYNNDLEVEY